MIFTKVRQICQTLIWKDWQICHPTDDSSGFGLDCLFPNHFVEGLATRDFEPAIRFLVGELVPLSPSSISRLNKKFKAEYERWEKRDLSKLKIVYIWADGGLGFWAALPKVWRQTIEQLCWLHKMRNILDKEVVSIVVEIKIMGFIRF